MDEAIQSIYSGYDHDYDPSYDNYILDIQSVDIEELQQEIEEQNIK